MKTFFMLIIIMTLSICCGCGGDSSSNPGDVDDLIIELNDMGAHVDQEIQMRAIDTSGELRSLAIIDVLPDDYLKVILSNLSDGSIDHLDFYADYNHNGEYDAPPADHAWRVMIPENGNVSFINNSSYTDIGSPEYTLPGHDFTINFQNYTGYIGKQMEIRVVEKTGGRRVGYYLQSAIPNAVFTVNLPGIIRDGTMYQIDFFIDRNVNGLYDIPPEDPAWRVELRGTGEGLNFNFSNNLDYTDIGA